MFKLFRMNSNNLNRSNNMNVLPFCYELIFKSNLTPKSDLSTEASSSSKSIEDNPYYAKYADKIKNSQNQGEKLKEQASLKQPEDVIQEKREETNVGTAKQADNSKSTFTVNKSNNFKRSLDDILKLDKIKDMPKETIIEIWNSYHSKKDCIYASIPADTYEKFFKNSQTYSSFILPLPRKSDSQNSYEFFLLEFQEHVCFFTPLAAYHLHKEMAPICFTVYHYSELIKTKDIVLMVGEFDPNVLNIMECQCLANQLQYYYTTTDASSMLSLHLFNKEPKSFDHMRLIKQVEEGLFTNAMESINLAKQD